MEAKVQFNIYTVTPLGCTTSSQFTWKYIILHKYNITVFFQGYISYAQIVIFYEVFFRMHFCTTNIYYTDGYS